MFCWEKEIGLVEIVIVIVQSGQHQAAYLGIVGEILK